VLDRLRGGDECSVKDRFALHLSGNIRREPEPVDARSREIHDPNNSKHDNDRDQTEAEHEPNIVPGHALSRLARRYYWALFRAVGRVHGAFLFPNFAG
jgi:hypothetical protein